MLPEIDELALSYIPNEDVSYDDACLEYLFRIIQSVNVSFYEVTTFIALLTGLPHGEVSLVESNSFLTAVAYTAEPLQTPSQKFKIYMDDIEFEMEFCRLRNISSERLHKIRRISDLKFDSNIPNIPCYQILKN